MSTIVPIGLQSHELLNHILDQPELPSIIQSLDAGVLARLVRHIGLEDSAEIISLATMDQLKSILDEDLWQSRAPGEDEVFDADRFGLWLEILFETHPTFAARKVLELDEGLVTLGLCKLVLVVDLDDLALYLGNPRRSARDDMLDKVLESTLSQEFDGYLVIAKSDLHWDAIQALFVELNELDGTSLYRLLERCCRVSCEYIEDNGGLFDVLTSEEMLESDLAADRETRREEKGFVMPSDALYFLNMARVTGLGEILRAKRPDPVTRAYFNSQSGKESPVGRPSKDGRSARQASSEPAKSKTARFLQTLQAAKILPAPYQKRLDHLGASPDPQLTLVNAMRILKRTQPPVYEKRLMELTYLSNILISGCEFKGRTFRPVEAAQAAASVCNLGGEYLSGTRAGKDDNPPVSIMADLLAKQRLVKFFQLGWKILNDAVILHSAMALLKYFDRRRDESQDPKRAREMGEMADILKTHVSSGRPWEFSDQLDQLHACFDSETIVALTALLQSYPTLSEVICRKGRHPISPHICSHGHIGTIRQFLISTLGG